MSTSGAGDPTDVDDVIERNGGRGRFPLPRWRLNRWKLPRIALILGAAGLVVGLGGGYAAGVRHDRGAAPRAPAAGGDRSASNGAYASSLPLFTGSYPLSQAGPVCSAQVGQDELQLGVEVQNESATAATLRWIEAGLPLGGLRLISQGWGPCGTMPAATTSPPDIVPATGNTWFTATFQVLVACPQALPVQFTLGYTQDGQNFTASLPGFSDLDQVAYGQCPAKMPPDGTLTG